MNTAPYRTSTLLVLLFGCASSVVRTAPASGTAPFVLDGNRVYAELVFTRPDNSIRRALAFVDMGSATTIVTAALFKELELDRGKPLRFRIGDLPVTVPAADVYSDPSAPRSVGSDLMVEAMLPAGVMQRYEIVLDYGRRTLTFALPGTIRPAGARVPFRINPQTGLIAVDAVIDGKSQPVTIDNGSAYTWFRQDAAKTWLAAHSGWERGVGAVGASNMTMAGDGSEATGILMRLPEIRVGNVTLRQVGALAVGAGRSPVDRMSLFDWYSTKNAIPVIGFIGGNALKAFRLTIDYPHRAMYWLRESEPDVSDLNQVGLTLRRQAGEYVVEAVATRNGKATVDGVRAGDVLARIDSLDTAQASLGQIYAVLHGKPGEMRVLILRRGMDQLAVRATVTAF